MADKKGAMGSGWRIKRGPNGPRKQQPDKNWDAQDTMSEPAGAVGDVPPAAKYSSVSGSTRTGTTSAVLRGRETSPYSPNFKREIGVEEEGRLIASHWGADKLTVAKQNISAPASTKKVGSAPPVRSAASPKAGPKPAAMPATNVRAKATTAAASASAGHSSTVMHTPTTSAATSTAPSAGASPNRKLTIPSDTSGGDSGVGKTIGGAATAVGVGLALTGLGKKIFSRSKAGAPAAGRAGATRTTPLALSAGRPVILLPAKTQSQGAMPAPKPAGKGAAVSAPPQASTPAPSQAAKPARGAALANKAASGTKGVSSAQPSGPTEGDTSGRTQVFKGGKWKNIEGPEARVEAQKWTNVQGGPSGGKPIEQGGSAPQPAQAAKPAKPRAAKGAAIATDTPGPTSSTPTTPPAATPRATSGANVLGSQERLDKVSGISPEFRAELNKRAEARRQKGSPIASSEAPKGKGAAAPASGPAVQADAGILQPGSTAFGRGSAAPEAPAVTTPSGTTIVRRKGIKAAAANAAAAQADAAAKAAQRSDVDKAVNPAPPRKPTLSEQKQAYHKASGYQPQNPSVVQMGLEKIAQMVKAARAAAPVASGQRATLGDVNPKLKDFKPESVTQKVEREIPAGQSDFEGPKEVQARQASEQRARQRAEMKAQTQVGSAVASDPGKAEREARKAAIEKHMKTKGFTKVETPTAEQIIEKERPAAARVGPSKTKTAAKGKFRMANQSQAALKRGRSRGGKAHKPARGAKLGGLLGGAVLAAGAASEAQAAPAGHKAEAVGGYLKEAGKGYAKDLLITGGLAAVPAVGPALATGYVGYRLAQGTPEAVKSTWEAVKGAAGAGASFYEAYKQKKASESAYGTLERAAKTRKKRQGLL